MDFMVIIMGLGLLFYILLGFRLVAALTQTIQAQEGAGDRLQPQLINSLKGLYLGDYIGFRVQIP